MVAFRQLARSEQIKSVIGMIHIMKFDFLFESLKNIAVNDHQQCIP